MSSLEGLRANWEVGRVAKEDASSEYSESEAKPPNPRLLIGWPYGGTRLLEVLLLLAAGSSIRGRRWNWKSEEGEGGHERKCKLCSRYRVCEWWNGNVSKNQPITISIKLARKIIIIKSIFCQVGHIR